MIPCFTNVRSATPNRTHLDITHLLGFIARLENAFVAHSRDTCILGYKRNVNIDTAQGNHCRNPQETNPGPWQPRMHLWMYQKEAIKDDLEARLAESQEEA